MLTMLLVAAQVAGSVEATSCERLRSVTLPDTTITSAALVPAGPFTPPATAITTAPRPLQIPVAACRVTGVVKPAVQFEVWMPASGWNGKFQGVGGGGFAGVISYGAMATALGRGYATASTDTGHSTPGGSWALGHPELVVDFAHRAIHEMTVKAKRLVEAFYGNRPRLSYFVGCSTGGRQGLMSAQRYPDDYDAIVAGAPANYWTHLIAGSLAPAMATLINDESRLGTSQLALLNKGALAACDAGDGVSDGLIENPPACRFDPGTMQCGEGGGEACLTAAQVTAARRIYTPATNPRTKATIFPGMAPGSEITWTATAGGPQPFAIPVEFYKYFVHENPAWDWKTFDLDKDVAAIDGKFGTLMNAVDPNLRPFAKRGGKVLMYHGWNDQLIQPGNSIDYYTSVVKTMGAKEADDVLRLFMAPGMQHCAGGVGPNTFDALTVLEQWVEHGTKPARILASHATSGVVDRTRPLCPYPQVARYSGQGSIDDAASFTCTAPSLSSSVGAQARSLRILLTNDDGFDSAGLAAMRTALIAAGHQVTVVAPATNMSSTGMSMTSGVLKVEKKAEGVWAVHGTPADSAMIGLQYILRDTPQDLVISGTNAGQNLGSSSNSSGTVSAAIAAARAGVPAIATSAGIGAGADAAYAVAATLTTQMIVSLDSSRPAGGKLLPEGIVINVNVPRGSLVGLKWAPLSRRSAYTRLYTETGTPGEVRSRLTASTGAGSETDSDLAWFNQGYVTLTLLDGDLNARASAASSAITGRLSSLALPQPAGVK